MSDGEPPVRFQGTEPFGVDGDELAGLTPAQAFTLGVEWEILRSIAKTGADIHTHPVHADNSRRLQAMLSRHGYHQVWDHRDDWSFVTASLEAPE